MRLFTKKWTQSVSPAILLLALALMHCEPGKSLNPITKPTPPGDAAKTPKIELIAAPSSVLPTDTGAVQIAISDSVTGLALKGAKISITSTRFAILSASANEALELDSVPDDGKVSFRIFSSASGNGTISVKVTVGSNVRVLPIEISVTEKPVAPKIVETLPQKLVAKETTLVAFQILDSAQEKPLANAAVSFSSTLFSIFAVKGKDTVSVDTTGADGRIAFRVLSLIPGTAGTIQLKVKTAAGISRQVTFTLSVAEETGSDRPRKMTFTAVTSTLRADGTDSTELRVLVKDDNNNPLSGEELTFTSTGGVVKAQATTDIWGLGSTTLKSERVNRSVIVTATLVKTGATAQQTVAFDGVTITISPAKRVLMKDSIDPIIFELKDGSNVPMSGDSLEIVVKGAHKGFAQSDKESLLVVTDTRGQYKTNVTSHDAKNVIVTARALGAKSVDTITYTNNTLSLATAKASIWGDGLDQSIITATLKTGTGTAIKSAELRWSTTFGTFTTKPFTSTSASGTGSITLKSAQGSGLAIVNVEADTIDGSGNRILVASGNITVRVKALTVARLEVKVTPDNIPVKIGETKLIATAYDSSNNVMTGCLVSFRLVKGAGGGDEVISPPVDYTKAGQAEATLKAGGVISLYRGVKIAAVALDISGPDTLVIASSDTVGLTISGPPHKVSVGVNILKGINENDGTFGLPAAAVVTDVNGNLVADGTPVNFSTTPTIAWYPGLSYHLISVYPYYSLSDTIWYDLPWGDYNNNKKLDPDEVKANRFPTRPARGEDIDGNGVVNLPPEAYEDINYNGVWDATNPEPKVLNVWSDSGFRSDSNFVDFNKNGIRDTIEPFYDINGDGKCQCTGQIDASGNLYEETYFGSSSGHPFPGEVSVGVTRQVETLGGRALTRVVYVQSMARRVTVRLTAEANGIRAFVDVYLPIIVAE